MPSRQPAIPSLWLITDARNDAALDQAVLRLPRGSGVIFRHYHLGGAVRLARWRQIARLARRRGHVLVLSGTVKAARQWRAQGAYGAPGGLAGGGAMLRLATVHSLHELAQALRARADAVLLSPVFPTASHPGGASLGPVRFRLIAARSQVPVIALGGMNPRLARRAGAQKWAGIDHFTQKATRGIRADS